MARKKIKISCIRPKPIAKSEPTPIRAHRAPRRPRSEVLGSYRLRNTLLLLEVFPVARVMHRWKQCLADQELTWFTKVYVAAVVSVASAAMAGVAVWWPLQFRKQVDIDAKWSRMGMLFCVFGLQLGQSVPWTLNELFGPRLVTLVLIIVCMAWQHVSAYWRIREAFLVGCFLCGASLPAYQCIGYGTLVKLFADSALNVVMGLYAVVSVVGVVISRPSPLVATAYLVAFLLTVTDGKLPLQNDQYPLLSTICLLLLRLEPSIIFAVVLMIIFAK